MIRSALIASLLAGPAWAANCAPHDVVVGRLSKDFGETVQAVGITQTGKGFIEIFAAENGTWTIIVTSPHGLTCVISTGAEFQTISQSDEEPT